MTKNRTARNTVLWTAAVALFAVGLIVFVSATGETKKGEALIENPGALIGIVFSSLATLMGILLPLLLRAEKSMDMVKENVQNDHKKSDGSPLYLRDDLDGKHDVILEKLGSLADGVAIAIRLSEGNAADIRGMRRDVGRVRDDLAENTRETSRVARVVTGLVRTVDDVKARVDTHHPEEGSK